MLSADLEVRGSSIRSPARSAILARRRATIGGWGLSPRPWKRSRGELGKYIGS